MSASIGAISSESPKIRMDFDSNQPGVWKVTSRTWTYEKEGDTAFVKLLEGLVSTNIPIPQCSELRVSARMSLRGFEPVPEKWKHPGIEILFKDEFGKTIGSRFNYVKLSADTTGFVEVSEEFKVPPGSVSVLLMIRVTKPEADLRIDSIELECL